MRSGISRRKLLLAAAATASSSPFAAWSRQRNGPLSADVIIVGCGTAGMSAAIHAAARGAKVIVVEKGSEPGGTLWHSGGQMSAAGTAIAARLGIVDSDSSHFEDVMRLGEQKADPDLVRLAVRHAAETVNWFDDAGVAWRSGHPVNATGHEPYSARRVFAPQKAGVALLQVMTARLAAVQRATTMLYSTDAVELIQDHAGTVEGVVVRDSANHRIDLRAPRVFLTSGGATGNPGVFERFNGTPQYRTPWWPLNTGAGHDMAVAAGGFIRGVHTYLPDIGTVPATRGWPAAPLASANHYPERRPPWEIHVNSDGRRFMREDHPSIDAREKSVAKQTEHVYWAVYDSHAAERAPPFLTSADGRALSAETVQALARQYPTICVADTLDALAVQCGLPGKALQKAVEDYNAGQSAGRDEFGRVHMPAQLRAGPFHAVMMRGASLLSFGGVAVNRDLQVIRPSGEPVVGLYAAGEILGAGALMGRGYSSGMMVTPAISFGRVLGQYLQRRD